MTDWNPYEAQQVDSVRSFGVELKKGDRVRLWPVKTADILDMALMGKTAVIESIEQDFENKIYLAVTIEEDPGQDLGKEKQIGHRFFFSPEEVEALIGDSEREDR